MWERERESVSSEERKGKLGREGWMLELLKTPQSDRTKTIYEEFSVRRTCGAGRHIRRMPSELGCSAGCMEKCCLPFMAIIFVAHLAGEWT